MSLEPYRYVTPDEMGGARSELSSAELSLLDEVNQKIAARESLEQTINFLFEATARAGPSDRISLAFVQDDARVVSYYTVAAYEPVLLKKGYAEDLSGSSLQAVIARGTPRIIYDLEQYAQERPHSRSTRLLLREGVRSSMTCPLTVEGRHVGLLFRSARVPRAYDRRQVALHAAVAERLGQAVEKAYLIEQLRAANRAYSEMLGFVSHELKAPVAAIMQNAQLLLEGYLGELTAEQRARIKRMVAKGNYLLGLVNEYLDLARLEGSGSEAKPQSDVNFVADVLEPAVDIVTPQSEARGVRLSRHLPADGALVQLDPQLLRIVLVNLLSNAVKYGNEGGEARVTVARDPDALRVAVWNEGPGFPPSERDRLFRKFSRLQVPELLQRKGTGVGLYTCWRVIQMHHGRIEADSEEGRWAEFRFTIPQPLPEASTQD
jgi:signal transduction histidine kinase